MLEIKNTITKMKSGFAKPISRLGMAQEILNKLDDRSIKTFYNEIQRINKLKKKKTEYIGTV